MYRRIVVPLDLTPEAEAAIAHGACIARQAGAALELLTITPTYDNVHSARQRLEETAERHGVTAEVTATDSGDPARVILEEADAADTLICLRTHARRPLGELTLGSVSEQVMRSCRQPVLLVGPHCGPAPKRFESMVVALDGSEPAEQILPTVARWAGRMDVTPWLFQVLPGRVPLETGRDDFYETNYVHRVAGRLAGQGMRAEWDVAHDHNPAAAIARFAEDRPDALIALTTRGRSGYSRLVMGSVALAVAHRARVPVLTLHPTEPE